MAMKKIPSSDRCHYCGHWSGDDEDGFRIYSEARAKWLESAVKMLYDMTGDDDWVDWMDEGKELSKKGE